MEDTWQEVERGEGISSLFLLRGELLFHVISDIFKFTAEEDRMGSPHHAVTHPTPHHVTRDSKR